MSKKALNLRYDVLLYPIAPFNFDGTVHKPSHFPSSDNTYEVGLYWQTMRYGGRVLGTRMTNKGLVNQPCVELSIFAAEELSPDYICSVSDEVEYRFDFKADLSDFYQRFMDDEILGPVLDRWRGMRIMANASLYEYLVIATVLQNATVKRSVLMFENLLKKYGTKVTYDGKELSVCWLPEAIYHTSEQELRAQKVGYRAKQLKRQAQLFVFDELDEFHLRTLPPDDLKTTLLEIYGIGPASVWYLMFEIFKRYDALDYISPWEQKIYSRLLFDEELVSSEVILNEVMARWDKWRMLAMHYIFEDLFWKRKTQPIPWLEKLIRL